MENQEDMGKFWMTIGIVAVVVIVAVVAFRTVKTKDDPGLDPGRAGPAQLEEPRYRNQ